MVASVLERMTARIVVSKVHQYGGSMCVESTASIDRYGYSRISVDGKMKKAHRVAYELFVGPIPQGLVIDHKCTNRCCINPLHLEAVTQAVNVDRIYNR